MADTKCTQCGQPLPADGTFCTHCGAVIAPSAPGGASPTLFEAAPAPAPEKASQATMFGFAAGSLGVKLPPPPAAAPVNPAPIVAVSPASSPPPAPTPEPNASRASQKHTMLGIASPLQAAASPPAAAAPAPAPVSSFASSPSAKGTMIGVALPGIAPLQASASPPASPVVPRRGPSSTMLGVATPGIAPIHSTGNSAPAPATQPKPVMARTQPLVLPKPAPLVDDEPALGPAPRVDRRGVPLAYVAGGVFGLVLMFGAAVALLWKGQALVVVPRLDAQGHDQLHLVCDSCQDGTTATLDASTATFQGKEADLTLAAPLAVGDNALSIRLDRPRWGRDEDVKVVVPVAFRIKADLAALTGAHPTVVVRLQAIPGTVAKIDGKPVTLDAHGEGSYSIDVSAQTTGWSDDLRLIDQSIPYSIVPGPSQGRTSTEQHGNLAVRAGIATLHMDAPGPTSVIDGGSFRIAGHTVKGGTVTANGQPVPVEPDGTFSRAYEASTQGDIVVELRADGPQLASRTAKLTVRRVARLADEAKARERAAWVGYDAIMADTTGSVGKDTVVEGEVFEARSASNQVVALIDDTRGCPKGMAAGCLVRVVTTGDETLKHGQHVRVYGKVTAVLPAAAGTTSGVPVVQADFLVKGSLGRR